MGETSIEPRRIILPLAEPLEQIGPALGTQDLEHAGAANRLGVIQKTSIIEDTKYGQLYNSGTQQVVWPIPGLHDNLELWADYVALSVPILFKTLADPLLNTGVPIMPLLFIPVDGYKDRSLFKDNQLRCASIRGGGYTRNGFLSPATGANSCLECPLRLWKDRALQDENMTSEVEALFGPGDGPACNENLCFPSLLPDLFTGQVEGVLISFSKTSMKAGRALSDMMKRTRMNAWARMYALWPTEEVNPAKQSYAVLNVRQVEGGTPLEFLELCAEAFASLHSD